MKKHSIDSLAALMLFAVYALCISLVLLVGGNAYVRICGRGSDSYNNRVCVQYITSSVRSADQVEVSSIRGTQMLLLHSGDYVKKVYYHEGYLMELYTRPDADLVPEAGYKIAEVDGFGLSYDAGVLKVTGITVGELVICVRGERDGK